MPSVLEPAVLERAAHRGTLPTTLAHGRQARLASIMNAAEFLPQAERELLRLHFEQQVSLSALASLAGCNAGTMSRRVRRTVRRLQDPIVQALVTRQVPIADDDRRVGIDRFLRGHGIRRLAADHGLTTAEVRRRLAWITGWGQGRRDGAWAVHQAHLREHERRP